jgi:hypothetical protein
LLSLLGKGACLSTADHFVQRATYYRQLADASADDWSNGVLLDIAIMFECMALDVRDRKLADAAAPGDEAIATAPFVLRRA